MLARRAFLLGAAALAAAPRLARAAPCSPGGKAHWRVEPDLVQPGWHTLPAVAHRFLEAIPSWEAETQPGGWIEVELRSLDGAGWSDWAKLGRWQSEGRRGSTPGQPTVQTDTLVLDAPAEAVQARVGLFGEGALLRSLSLALSGAQDQPGVVAPLGIASDLDVPARSQMVFPDGGRVWCSPTSTSMVLAYWAGVLGKPELDRGVPEVVEGVWDHAAGRNGIGGNWPFNTAYAASLGVRATVARLSSLADVEQWTAAGVPVIASIRFRGGELSSSPIWSALGGHLLVIRGFSARGAVLVNDPAAASDSGVPRRYDRYELEKAWLGGSNGVVYLIYPPAWSVPELVGPCA